MRVLIVIPSLTPEAGAERSMAAVLPFLMDAGLDVDIAVLTQSQELVPEAVASGARVHDLSRSRGVRLAPAIRSLIRARRPDLVHATLFQASVPAQLAALGTGVPVLVTWANTPTDRSTEQVAGWKLRVVQLIDLVMAHVGRVRFHAVTEGVARTKAQELKVSPARVMVAERGRDPDRFCPPAAEERLAARRELAVAAGDQVLLVVGRQEPQKGYVDLIEAFDQVASRAETTQLFIAGRPGSGTPAILDALARATHGSRIHLLGHRDNVVPLLHAADVMVCASHREGAAGALIEAMGCGVPIVSVELDGLRGVLEDGVNARFVPREALADAITSVLDDRDTAHRLADAASDLFRDRFTVERSAASLHGVYLWAAGDDRATAK